MGISTDQMVDDKPSSEELKVLSDTTFLSNKFSVSQKVITYLAEIERAVKHQIENTNFQFPNGCFINAGKISKGENYAGLPYFILDYPRLFSRKEVFAFRTMLWWGHEFSCTLHLSGPILENLNESFFEKIQSEEDFYFCISDTPWQYHFQSDNYKKVTDLSVDALKNQIDSNHFIKISRYIAVTQWDEYKSFTLESFARFLQLLK